MEEATGRVVEALDGAVGRALGDDGGSGVMLSGGLDSTTVASCAIRVLGRRGLPAPRAYTAVFPGHPDVDESFFSERVASQLNLPWTRASVQRWQRPGGRSRLPADLGDARAVSQPLLRPATAAPGRC